MSHDIYFASHATPFHPPSFAAYVDLHPWLSWTRGSAESESAEITYFHPNTEVTFVYERFVASSGPRWSCL